MYDHQALHVMWLSLGLVLWIVLIYFEGIRDARFYSLKKENQDYVVEKFRFNIIKLEREFPLFTTTRVVMYFTIVLVKSIALFYYHNTLDVTTIIILLLSILLVPVVIFPFFHDGAYYKERNKIDGKFPDKWVTNNTKRFGLMWRIRVLGLLFAVVLVIFEICSIYHR